MFVQIAPHVKVFLNKEQIDFLEKYKNQQSFTDHSIQPNEIPIAKLLADKAILVKKNLTLECNTL